MLSTITNFFEKHLHSKKSTDEKPTTDKLQLASAALMIELCRSDQSTDNNETQALLTILKDEFSLDEASVTELMSLGEQEASNATSLYEFTSLFNKEYEYTDKTLLIKNMWKIAYADGNLDRYEDSLIRKVADLLYVTHSDFIKAKLAIKNNLPC